MVGLESREPGLVQELQVHKSLSFWWEETREVTSARGGAAQRLSAHWFALNYVPLDTSVCSLPAEKNSQVG